MLPLTAWGTAWTGDNDMDTPLHRCETVECAKLLLEHGAELNERNSEGRTVRSPLSLVLLLGRQVNSSRRRQ